jgi:hypothetical protein
MREKSLAPQNGLERELILALQALIAASAAIKQRSVRGSPG